MDKREQALARPGGLDKAKAKVEDPPLHEVISQYELETKRDVGHTKKQVLKTIRESDRVGASHVGQLEALHPHSPERRQVCRVGLAGLDHAPASAQGSGVAASRAALCWSCSVLGSYRAKS